MSALFFPSPQLAPHVHYHSMTCSYKPAMCINDPMELMEKPMDNITDLLKYDPSKGSPSATLTETEDNGIICLFQASLENGKTIVVYLGPRNLRKKLLRDFTGSEVVSVIDGIVGELCDPSKFELEYLSGLDELAENEKVDVMKAFEKKSESIKVKAIGIQIKDGLTGPGREEMFQSIKRKFEEDEKSEAKKTRFRKDETNEEKEQKYRFFEGEEEKKEDWGN